MPLSAADLHAQVCEHLGLPDPGPYEPAPGWYYLSFVHTDRPTDDQFVGGCYVAATSAAWALTVTHILGINPGGEAKILGPLPEDVFEATVLKGERYRLLSRAEIEAQGARGV